MRAYSPIDFAGVTISGDFWRERLETVLSRTIPSQHRKLEESGILESLRLPQPPPPLRIPRNEHNFTTQIFWDSDVGKWIEAASYALNHRRDARIEKQIDTITDWLEDAQAPDGYLNCWYLGREPERRWTNLRDNHELYCAGHLLEGAIAYFRATGSRRLLDIMVRYVDHIAETFGPGEDQKHGYCGHQEIELALIKLYGVTGERRHLDLAAWFINERGKSPNYFDIEAIARGDDPEQFWAGTYEYNQSHRPVRDQDKVVGHAVRAMYMYAAMADLAAELSDNSLTRTLESLWHDVTSRQMYVTAGLGPSKQNEGFTTWYDLPNDTAYAETCASVALIFWAHRMLNIDLDGRYAEVMERALYNGVLSGLSRDGEHYFYDNPLESDGRHGRWAWHTCPCCTMNVSRLVASVGGYVFSTGRDVIAMHLYGGAATQVVVAGVDVAIREMSSYPWSGRILIEIDPASPAEFVLKLRIPAWAKGARARINGQQVDVSGHIVKGYLEIRRLWSRGDSVELDLPMPAERLYAHPAIRHDVGRVALRRGPLIYCVEQVDNAGTPIEALRLPKGARVMNERRPDLFDGVVTVVAECEAVLAAGWDDTLYRSAPPEATTATLTAIPYYLWANRQPGPMRVWIPEG